MHFVFIKNEIYAILVIVNRHWKFGSSSAAKVTLEKILNDTASFVVRSITAAPLNPNTFAVMSFCPAKYPPVSTFAVAGEMVPLAMNPYTEAAVASAVQETEYVIR